MDTVRIIGGYKALNQRGIVDYGSHLPVPVTMSSSEVEYISTAIACMRASYLRILIYDLKFWRSRIYDAVNLTYDPARIIIDNAAAIAMTKRNKDTAGNCHFTRRYHYV